MRSSTNNLIKLHRPTVKDSGFSLPLAIVAGFVVLFGTLALTNRSTQSLFGALFLAQSSEAKDAAETGMSHFVGELNIPRNRWLLVKRAGEKDQGLWANRSNDINIRDLRQNPCLLESTGEFPRYTNLDPGSTPRPADDSSPADAYGYWYVASNGSISSSSTGAVKRYRLKNVTRQTFASDAEEKLKFLSVNRSRGDNPTGVGRVILEVEGQSLRNGKVISSVILKKEFELAPKCCNIPFGNAHGKVDYQPGTFSLCLQAGLGLLAGASGTDSGVITVNGNNDFEQVNDDGTIGPLNNIYCLASNTSGCSINKNNNQSVKIIDFDLPGAPEFCSDLAYNCGTDGPPPPGDFVFNQNDTDTSQFIYYLSGGGGAGNKGNGKKGGNNAGWFVIDTKNSSSGLPSFCKEDSDTVYCNLNTLDYKNKDLAIVTGDGSAGSGKKLVFFFNSGGEIVRTTGNDILLHCSEFEVTGADSTSCNNNGLSASNLAFYGSNTLTTPQQTVYLAGTPDADLQLFMYLPTANVTLNGNSTFSGLLWTEELRADGNTTWTIRVDALDDAYRMTGMANPNGNVEPLIFDFQLRATNRQQLLGL